VVTGELERLERTISTTNKEFIIGIVVVQSEDQFSDPIKDRARSAGYNIILTGKNNLYSALTEFIEYRNILDSSNNNGEREEIERRRIEVRDESIRVEVETRWIEGEIVRMRGELIRRRNIESFVIWFLISLIGMILYFIIYKFRIM